MSQRTPLAKALGRGSAKDGTRAWLAQRVTSVALAPLGLWLAAAFARQEGFDYAQASAWVASPFNAVALVLLLIVAAHHAKLGVQVVVEDYVHSEWVKIPALLAVAFLAVAFAVAGVFAVLRISLGAGG